MKKLVIAAAALAASATTSTACVGIGCPAVPEISALEGMAAVAVVASVVLLMWERRRRA